MRIRATKRRKERTVFFSGKNKKIMNKVNLSETIMAKTIIGGYALLLWLS